MFPITYRHQCPYCRSTSIERQPRPIAVRYLLCFMDTRYYQCERCRRYFVKLSNKTPQTHPRMN